MTDESPIRVLCVDDNEMVGEAIGVRLRCAAGFAWLGLLPTADELLLHVGALLPDLVILDVDMPGRDPFEAVAIMSEAHPSVRVLVLSGHVRRDLVESALDAGAWGYVSKDASADDLLSSLRRVHAGELVLGADVESVLDG